LQEPSNQFKIQNSLWQGCANKIQNQALLIEGMIFIGLRPANPNTHSPPDVPLAVGAYR